MNMLSLSLPLFAVYLPYNRFYESVMKYLVQDLEQLLILRLISDIKGQAFVKMKGAFFHL